MLSENFRVFYCAVRLYMDKIWGRSSLIWFFWWPSVVGGKCSKNDMNFDGTDRNLNPFRLFTRTLCNIHRQKFIEIRGMHLGKFPRGSTETIFVDEVYGALFKSKLCLYCALFQIYYIIEIFLFEKLNLIIMISRMENHLFIAISCFSTLTKDIEDCNLLNLNI
jgi:hypothetical protein